MRFTTFGALRRGRSGEMLVVETVARIRREFFVKGKPIKEIVRDLGVSRNTVRKVLRSGETAFAYERSVQPLPKLGPWAADLEQAAGSERPQDAARAADDDPHLRGVAGARLRWRL